jgi:hypothetical protein
VKVRAKGDIVELRLTDGERELLRFLLPQIRDLLIVGEHPLTRRLFPPAYANDVEAERDYRELAHDDLLAKRLGAVDLIEGHLDQDRVVLEETGVTEWLQGLNSLRLVLGTRLDVSEEDDPADLDPDDEDFPLWQAYHVLSYLLDAIVTAVS